MPEEPKKRSEEPGDDQRQVETILTELRAEIGEKATEREQVIVELQRRNRQRIDEDPVASHREAVIMLGMIGRRIMCAYKRTELPTEFREESKRLDDYLSRRAERATLDIQTTSGGYFMPTVLQLDMIDQLEQISELIAGTDFVTGMPTKGTIPVLTGRPTLQPKRASSDTDMTQSDFAFSEMDFATNEAYIFFPVDNWLMQLSPFALGSFLLPRTRDAYLQGMADWLLNADGTSSYNSVTGILNESTAAYITTMGGATFADLSNADLRKAMRNCLKRGRVNGSFIGSGYVIDVLDEIDRSGKTPILRELAGGGFSVKGKPFVEEEGMPDEADSAADTAFLAFGDLKTYSVIMAGQGIEMAMSSEVLFKRNQTAIRAMAQFHMERKPVNTFQLVKTKA